MFAIVSSMGFSTTALSFVHPSRLTDHCHFTKFLISVFACIGVLGCVRWIVGIRWSV